VTDGEDKPYSFICPICGASDNKAWITIETIAKERYRQVALWPGGPLVDDRSAPARPVPVDRVLSTSACEHLFPLSAWVWTLHPDDGRTLVTIEARPAPLTDEAEPAPRPPSASRPERPGVVVVLFGSRADDWCDLERCPLGTAAWFPDRTAAAAYCKTMPEAFQPHILIVHHHDVPPLPGPPAPLDPVVATE
jgi:hypothetical protein